MIEVSHVAFTGTREGMTRYQAEAVRAILYRMDRTWPHVFHHGDCLGADEEFHGIVREVMPDHVIKGHPPEKSTMRAFCEVDELVPPEPYLARNRHMVEESRMLIATPATDGELLRSGTWTTVRHARKYDREITVIGPAGDYVEVR